MYWMLGFTLLSYHIETGKTEDHKVDLYVWMSQWLKYWFPPSLTANQSFQMVKVPSFKTNVFMVCQSAVQWA